MSGEDDELERLKARRLAEMQKNLSSREERQPEPPRTDSPRKILEGRLGFRGAEVLQNAESQFPNETRMVVQKLAELIQSGEISEVIDGGQLLSLFRTIGLYIRMDTRINIEQDGKFVSLGEKLGQSAGDGP